MSSVSTLKPHANLSLALLASRPPCRNSWCRIDNTQILLFVGLLHCWRRRPEAWLWEASAGYGDGGLSSCHTQTVSNSEKLRSLWEKMNLDKSALIREQCYLTHSIGYMNTHKYTNVFTKRWLLCFQLFILQFIQFIHIHVQVLQHFSFYYLLHHIHEFTLLVNNAMLIQFKGLELLFELDSWTSCLLCSIC